MQEEYRIRHRGVAHNQKQINSPYWKHKKIVKCSKSVTGVDILKDEIEYLNTRGYHFVHMDATSDGYLGEKFDIVHAGDVIEHVDNIGGLLAFAKRHCKKDGTILISTCCPFFYEAVFSFMKKQGPRDNMEHVSWITPQNMNELCCRTGLEFVCTYYLIAGIWGYRLLNLIRKGILPKEYFTSIYIYELKLLE